MDDAQPFAKQLTPRGQATRARIVAAAAELIRARGISGTSNEDIRKTAGVSGSQLTHYFPDKDSLVLAVISWRAEQIVAAHKAPGLGQLDSLPALHRWAETYVDDEALWRNGCSYGSLAAEAARTAPSLRPDLDVGFQRWQELFRVGLRAMRQRGELQEHAEPDELASVLMAAFQGGTLLAQVAGNPAPLKAALDAALSHVESYATTRSEPSR